MGSYKPYRQGGRFEDREEFRRQLFEKQKGICHLCGKPMTMDRKTNSRKPGVVPSLFASFDHVVPHSKGGGATWSNLKLAHRSCNSRRNDRPLPYREPL